MLFRIAEHIATEPGRAAAEVGIDEGKLARLRAVVLLAGSVRANPLRRLTGRGPLEMPVTGTRSVLGCWREQLVAMAEVLGLEHLPVRVMVDRNSAMPRGMSQDGPVQMSIETDPSEFRGTGGLLSDLAREYRDDDLILVTHGSQLLFEPLAELASAVARASADVSMVCSRDGTPSGLMLMRCGCLRKINPVGFVDLNEQALPAIARQWDVRVVRYDQPTALSLRTLSSYIDTLREYHQRHSGRLARSHGLIEDWRPSFDLIEAGAKVHDSAVMHDSVVLGGARIDAGAVIVRCVVCPGAVVGRGKSEVDRVVGGRGSVADV